MLLSILHKVSKLLLVYLLFANSVYAATFADLKFGQYQTADSQWNVSSCYYSPASYNGCQIYSKAPGVTYKIPWTSGRLTWAAGDYIKFAPSGNASYPWTATQYNSNGTVKAVLGTGKVIYAGLVNADGYFFFMGNDNNTGQLFSLTQGMNSTTGLTFTGSINPDVTTLNNYASNYGSTTPLAAGETASAPPPAAATPVYASGITAAQQTRKTAALNGLLGHTASVAVIGDDNDIYIHQAAGRHVADINVSGNTNNLNILQTGQGYTGVQHYLELTVDGSNNALTVNQKDTNKTAFMSVNGNYNTANVLQQGTGNHYLQLGLMGNNHTANVTQSGTGSHNATVELTNGGGAWNFTLNQNGSTAQTYSLPHTMSDNSAVSGTCSAVGGCNLTVNQQ